MAHMFNVLVPRMFGIVFIIEAVSFSQKTNMCQGLDCLHALKLQYHPQPDLPSGLQTALECAALEANKQTRYSHSDQWHRPRSNQRRRYMWTIARSERGEGSRNSAPHYRPSDSSQVFSIAAYFRCRSCVRMRMSTGQIDVHSYSS